jgi:hypothetical protein
MQEMAKKDWVRLRFVIRRIKGQNGVPCTSKELFVNNKKYFVGRVDMQGTRYSIGQTGVNTGITNFLVRRIEPRANPSGF